VGGFIADHVGVQFSCKPSLNAFFGHDASLSRLIGEILFGGRRRVYLSNTHPSGRNVTDHKAVGMSPLVGDRKSARFRWCFCFDALPPLTAALVTSASHLVTDMD